MPGLFKSIGNFLFGTKEKRENVSTLRPQQEGLYNQLVSAGKQPGVGGAFGTAADYYRNLLGNESPDYQAFQAPALRQYYQDIVPSLSEQFAGMGSGGIGSSGFRNAQLQGATDLAERLGAIRANLRQVGAQGLQNIGGLGLQNFSQNMVTQPGTPGLLGSVAPAFGSGLASGIGSPIGRSIGNGMFNWFGANGGNQVAANTSGYSPTDIPASPRVGSGSGRPTLPGYLEGTRYGGY